MTPMNRIQRAMLMITSSSRTRKGIRDNAFSFTAIVPQGSANQPGPVVCRQPTSRRTVPIRQRHHNVTPGAVQGGGTNLRSRFLRDQEWPCYPELTKTRGRPLDDGASLGQ